MIALVLSEISDLTETGSMRSVLRSDIGENGLRAGIGDGICRGDERQIGNDDLIAGLQIEGGERKMKAGRAIAHRKRILGSTIAGETGLNSSMYFPIDDTHSGVQRVQDKFLFASSNERLRNRDEAV